MNSPDDDIAMRRPYFATGLPGRRMIERIRSAATLEVLALLRWEIRFVKVRNHRIRNKWIGAIRVRAQRLREELSPGTRFCQWCGDPCPAGTEAGQTDIGGPMCAKCVGNWFEPGRDVPPGNPADDTRPFRAVCSHCGSYVDPDRLTCCGPTPVSPSQPEGGYDEVTSGQGTPDGHADAAGDRQGT